jgi:hypothetical protein
VKAARQSYPGSEHHDNFETQRAHNLAIIIIASKQNGMKGLAITLRLNKMDYLSEL